MIRVKCYNKYINLQDLLRFRALYIMKGFEINSCDILY